MHFNPECIHPKVCQKKKREPMKDMKKTHAISNYYDNIKTYLDDSSKLNFKLYRNMKKDSFQKKLSTELLLI